MQVLYVCEVDAQNRCDMIAFWCECW